MQDLSKEKQLTVLIQILKLRHLVSNGGLEALSVVQLSPNFVFSGSRTILSNICLSEIAHTRYRFKHRYGLVRYLLTAIEEI